MLMICNVDFVGFVGISFSVDLVMTCEDDNSSDGVFLKEVSCLLSVLRRVECGCFVYCLLSLLVVRCAFCDVRCVL